MGSFSSPPAWTRLAASYATAAALPLTSESQKESRVPKVCRHGGRSRQTLAGSTSMRRNVTIARAGLWRGVIARDTSGSNQMPIHDWTRVTSGTFHAFHPAWIAHLQESLNAGLLPADYYALAEQFAGDTGPDVLTLETPRPAAWDGGNGEPEGGIAVAERPPRVQKTLTASSAFYLARPLTLVAYSAGVPPTAYVQPIGVGEMLPDMPLFLSPERYVDVPLETTYCAAWRGMPQRWRHELEKA